MNVLAWTSFRTHRRRSVLIGVLVALMMTVGVLPASADDDDDEEAGWGNAASINVNTFGGAMHAVNAAIGADDMWRSGYDGTGIDIALIDTGVVPVEGLDDRGKIVNGPDLSLDGDIGTVRYLDSAGHGTHLAGIIAGDAWYGEDDDDDDDEEDDDERDDDGTAWHGVAPDARIVNVKVGAYDGTVDVSQVIAAIDWVIEHRTAGDLNIRVLNLAYGTDSTQSHLIDPLSHAVERAWRAGIVVVTAAGNDGNASPLRNPAHNPFVITVGAASTLDGAPTLADFSSCGTRARTVDVLAPGQSIASLRNPGSLADGEHPEARVGRDHFLGSGTSQATAVVSGAVALLLDQRPSLQPDEVKALLTSTADPVAGAPKPCQGHGFIDLAEAGAVQVPPTSKQKHPLSNGSGSLDAARGTTRPVVNGAAISGEVDITGAAWSPKAHAANFAGGSWSGGSWSGGSWSGGSWSGGSWSGGSWSGGSWSGGSWSGGSWSGGSWSGGSWSGGSWSGGSWSGGSWSGGSWSASGWAGGVHVG